MRAWHDTGGKFYTIECPEGTGLVPANGEARGESIPQNHSPRPYSATISPGVPTAR